MGSGVGGTGEDGEGRPIESLQLTAAHEPAPLKRHGRAVVPAGAEVVRDEGEVARLVGGRVRVRVGGRSRVRGRVRGRGRVRVKEVEVLRRAAPGEARTRE